MFEFIIVALFIWLFADTVRLAFKATWRLAKAAAAFLFVVALPAMIGCLTVAGGIALLFPLGLVTLAFGVLKVYI